MTESRPMRILEQGGATGTCFYFENQVFGGVSNQHVTNQDVLLLVTILSIFIHIVFAKIVGSLTVVACAHFLNF